MLMILQKQWQISNNRFWFKNLWNLLCVLLHLVILIQGNLFEFFVTAFSSSVIEEFSIQSSSNRYVCTSGVISTINVDFRYEDNYFFIFWLMWSIGSGSSLVDLDISIWRKELGSDLHLRSELDYVRNFIHWSQSGIYWSAELILA